jgi:hypothetical protein
MSYIDRKAVHDLEHIQQITTSDKIATFTTKPIETL